MAANDTRVSITVDCRALSVQARLTANAHSIHIRTKPYALGVDGYPGLVCRTALAVYLAELARAPARRQGFLFRFRVPACAGRCSSATSSGQGTPDDDRGSRASHAVCLARRHSRDRDGALRTTARISVGRPGHYFPAPNRPDVRQGCGRLATTWSSGLEGRRARRTRPLVNICASAARR